MPNVVRRHGPYVAFAVATLAFAVGANLSVFTIVNALWLRPLPLPNPDRLVTLSDDGAGANEPAAFGGLEERGGWTAFEAVAGQVVTSGNLGGLRPRIVFERVGAELETLGVTSRYFQLLGQSIRGRDFAREDNRYGAEPVAIISDRLWSRAFGRDPATIGAIAAAKPFAIRIIGVSPPGFEGARRGEHADLWIPSNLVQRATPSLGKSALPEDAAPSLVLARLHPGQTPSDAERRLVEDAVSDLDRRVKERLRVVPLSEVFGTPDSRTIVVRERNAATVVAGLAALVLLAGCITLMTLVLVHYERRRRELAVRIALGASRRRMAGVLSAELAWLAGAGTAGALLVAVWSLRALPALTLPGGVDLERLDLRLDWRVIAAAVSTVALTLFAAALVPMRRFTRPSLVGELIGTGSTSAPSSQRLRQVLLGIHVSATIIVLVAGGLFVRAVAYGFSLGPAFDIDRTLYIQVQVVSPFASPDHDASVRTGIVAENTRRLMDALRALPGVDGVAIGPPPIGVDQASFIVAPRPVETTGGPRELRLGVMSGSSELLQVLGVSILRGRGLTDLDGTTRAQSAVITASLARTLWGSDEPIGQTVSVGTRRVRYTVVGVSADFIFGSLNQAHTEVLITVNPGNLAGMEPRFVVRTRRPDRLVETIRKVVLGVVPDAPRLAISTGHDILLRDLGRQRLGAWFFSGFGLVALILGAGGVFGLVSYMVESRRREFGVRLSLGATPLNLVRRCVLAGLVPVSIGAAGGLLVAALVTRLFVAWLPGLSALDPLTYAGVAALMVGCSAAAGIAAGWRVRSAAPADALRAE